MGLGYKCHPGRADAAALADSPRQPQTKQREFVMHPVSRRVAIRLGLLATAAPVAAAIPSLATEQRPLAINGYDPVAYFTIGRPERGLPEIEFEWDEHRYRFTRAEHRALFKADPVRYAPQFGNFCAMALTRGELEEANPEKIGRAS